jgi:tetratricopeptide (TPR) repeat protein
VEFPSISGFVIERELGRGGMGVVYQAWQVQLARRVAIKVVRAQAGFDAEDRRRWLREARAIGRVRHGNVVPLHEAGEQNGCFYLVFDLIPGGSLADRARGPLPEQQAAQLMRAVARGVVEIHRAGMVHLDIKPSNILLDGPPDGSWDQVEPRVADFGIARAGDDPGASVSGSLGVRGTPSYMAPEQVAGLRDAIGPRSDIFALGATLYSLLTGRPPFQAATVLETLDLVRACDPPSPRALVPGLSRDLETVVMTCLRKDPEHRYASAEALAEDLERWLAGYPVRARAVSSIEHATRWCRRRPAIAALLAILTLTVATSLVGLASLLRHSEAERGRAEAALASALASDKARTGAVRELVDLLATTVDSPQMLASERFASACQVIHDLAEAERRERRFDRSNIMALGRLAWALAESLRPRGKLAEAHALLIDSLALIEGRSAAGDDPELDEVRARALLELGLLDLEKGENEAAMVWTERAAAVVGRLPRQTAILETLVLLHGAQLSIATRLDRLGRFAERRRLLETHLAMLESGGDSGEVGLATGVLAALTRAQLLAREEATPILRAALQRFPADQPPSTGLRAMLASWIAQEVDAYPANPDRTGGPWVGLDPRAHARAVIQALESRCDALGLDRGLVPEIAHGVAVVAIGRGSEQRRSGQLDDARRTAAKLAAFAKRLVERDPDEPMYHIMLGQAFEQDAKNAWKTEDFAAIEDGLRKATAEARTALRLDPRNGEARRILAGLQEKLMGVPSAPRSPRAEVKHP